MKIVLNDDAELVAAATKAVKENDGYCPCALYKEPDTKCMCREFRECEEEGPCHCGRFKKIKE